MTALVLLLSTSFAADPFTPGLSLQPRYTATLDGDPDAADADRLSDAGFRIRRALFLASGTVGGRFDYRFRIDAAKVLSFNDGDGKSQLGQKPILDDAQITTKIGDPLQLAVGQWKVPFTASQLASDTTLLFIDRPLPIDGAKYGDLKLSGFSWSREAGAAALGSLADRRLDYQIGVFNGDGTNVWPTTDAAPLLVGRLSLAPLGELKYDEVDFAHGGPRFAVGLGATLERTPAFDADGARDGETQDLRAGADLRFAASGLTINGEVLYGQLSAADGSDPTRSLGAYAQLGYFLPVGVAPGLRWSRLDPSLDAEDDGLTQLEAVVSTFAPDPNKPGETLGHKAKIQLGWTTALRDGLDHPLYHQVQVATVIGF